MQNESDKLKTVLLGILELVTGDEIQINSHRFTPTEQNNVIALLTLLAGRHLGFTEEELIGALKRPETQPMQEASQLALRVAVIVNDSKEYQKQEMINSEDLFGEQIKKVTTETFKSKKVLLWLPSGITTTPAWLFEKFTTSSLANHGIRRVSQGRRTSLAGEAEVEYVIQLAKSDGVARISADTPITYLGFKKWE